MITFAPNPKTACCKFVRRSPKFVPNPKSTCLASNRLIPCGSLVNGAWAARSRSLTDWQSALHFHSFVGAPQARAVSSTCLRAIITNHTNRQTDGLWLIFSSA